MSANFEILTAIFGDRLTVRPQITADGPRFAYVIDGTAYTPAEAAAKFLPAPELVRDILAHTGDVTPAEAAMAVLVGDLTGEMPERPRTVADHVAKIGDPVSEADAAAVRAKYGDVDIHGETTFTRKTVKAAPASDSPPVLRMDDPNAQGTLF